MALNISAWPRTALVNRLGLRAPAPCRLSVSAWHVQPAQSGMFKRAPETWERCAAEVIGSMTIPEDEDHLQLRFTVPEAEKTRYGLMTRDLTHSTMAFRPLQLRKTLKYCPGLVDHYKHQKGADRTISPFFVEWWV
ncbi:hypothetical protein EZI54_18720 [Marinobacter halodurans]|uniref:Uncharacterized protein n=1 Tax=Marinobacter halodurans TaxID=2528979 RepID=A0ABY1ZG49_9GAMM|nr:hypothetical protein [Marinobacter halodurans]TBW50182.1 hypothetical protein EZI54_18720 [Marinobacter halodurans]